MGAALWARVHCYKVTRHVAFVRGSADTKRLLVRNLLVAHFAKAAGVDPKKHGAVQINVKTPVVDEKHADLAHMPSAGSGLARP